VCEELAVSRGFDADVVAAQQPAGVDGGQHRARRDAEPDVGGHRLHHVPGADAGFQRLAEILAAERVAPVPPQARRQVAVETDVARIGGGAPPFGDEAGLVHRFLGAHGRNVARPPGEEQARREMRFECAAARLTGERVVERSIAVGMTLRVEAVGEIHG
jgi:hypothetical protein